LPADDHDGNEESKEALTSVDRFVAALVETALAVAEVGEASERVSEEEQRGTTGVLDRSAVDVSTQTMYGETKEERVLPEGAAVEVETIESRDMEEGGEGGERLPPPASVWMDAATQTPAHDDKKKSSESKESNDGTTTVTIRLEPGVRLNVSRDHVGIVHVEKRTKAETREVGRDSGMKGMKSHVEGMNPIDGDDKSADLNVPPAPSMPRPANSLPPSLLAQWQEVERSSNREMLAEQLVSVRRDLERLERGLVVLSTSPRHSGGGEPTTTNQEEEEMDVQEPAPRTADNEEDEAVVEGEEGFSPVESEPRRLLIMPPTRNPLIVGLIGEVEESMRLLRLRRSRVSSTVI
jgi:hypothetical protein